MAAGVFLVLLGVSSRYGYHRDELYFIEAGRHPALGYPDQPLLTPMIARAAQILAPRSLLVLRLPAALAGVASIVSAGLLAREVGGTHRAQAIAACACAAGAATLAASHFLTTTSLDLGITSVALWLIVRLIARPKRSTWLWLGAVLAFGLLNKLLVGVLVGTVLVVLALIGPREAVRSRWTAVAAAMALLGVAPYLIWQFKHGVPQLDLARSQAQTSEEGGRAGVLPFQLVLVAPLLVPIWAAGLWQPFRDRRLLAFRCLPVAYFVLMGVLLVTGGKAYYLAGFYPALLGLGAPSVDRWLARAVRPRRLVLGGALGVSAGVSAIVGLCVLPERQLQGSFAESVNSTQGEMIGWPRFTDTVARVFASLKPATARHTAIFTINYGEAGALDLLGPMHGLPVAYSGHNGFSEWGPPPDGDTSAIVLGEGSDEVVEKDFRGCSVRARIDNGVGLNNQEQGAPVWFCEHERQPWSRIWRGLRHFN